MHYHWTRAENVRFVHHGFGPQFFSVNILSNLSAAYLTSFLYDTKLCAIHKSAKMATLLALSQFHSVAALTTFKKGRQV